MVVVRFLRTGVILSAGLCWSTLAWAIGPDRSGDPDIPTDCTYPEPHYYVDPAGNDSGAGTEADPWATLGPVGSLRSGTAYLKRGGSWEGSLSVRGITVSVYDTGARPVVTPTAGGTGFGGGVSVSGNACLEGVMVNGSGSQGITISGSGNVVKDCEIDGRVGTYQLGFGVTGTGNLIIGNYVHHLSAMSGDSGDMNTSGGAEAYMVMGSNNEIAYNSASEAHGENATLGGEEGGCYEIVNGRASSTIEDVYFHHNYCERSVGLFEACSGNFQGTDKIQENHGIIKNVVLAYNLSVDAMWLYLLQPVNTDFYNMVFEHNTIIHTPKNDSDFVQAARNSFGLQVNQDAGYTGYLSEGSIIVRNNIFYVTAAGAGRVGGAFMGDVPAADHYNNLFAGVRAGWTLGAGEVEVDDPGLTADYRLAQGSPAIDAGSNQAWQQWTDYDGNAVPLGAARDLGASEFCEGDSCQTPTATPETGGAPSTRGTGGASGGDTTTSTGGQTTATGGGPAATGGSTGTTTSTGGQTTATGGSTGTTTSTGGQTTATGGSTGTTTPAGGGATGTTAQAPVASDASDDPAGCGCSTVGARNARLGAMLSALLGLVVLGRRRQARG